MTRRRFCRGVAACAAAELEGRRGFSAARADAEERLAALEKSTGGRLGVYAFDTVTGRELAHRADERFLMCSTVKLPLAAAILARADRGEERLDARVHYSKHDILGHAPVAEAHLAKGYLTVGELCAAGVEQSDNTAANLLFARLAGGSASAGPAALTAFFRARGDGVTRFDRTELTLNLPQGDLDTTTPRAMVQSVEKLVLGDVLQPASRKLLLDWMLACQTGLTRLRAGFPSSWRVGDKTGTGNTEANDIAIAWLPGRGPVIVGAYLNAQLPSLDAMEAVLRNTGATAARFLLG